MVFRYAGRTAQRRPVLGGDERRPANTAEPQQTALRGVAMLENQSVLALQLYLS